MLAAGPALSLVLLVLAACSSGRTASDGGSGSESSDDGPSVETGAEWDDDDDDSGPWDCFGLGCFDVNQCPDPCDSTVCEGGLECFGGRCVAAKPVESCEGLALVDYELPLDFDLSGALLMADIDGIAGDELIVAGEGVVEVIRAGELLVSNSLPAGSVERLHPLHFDGDGHLDLLALSKDSDFVVVQRGDGDGYFEYLPAQLPGSSAWPFPLDFDNDGDHDILGVFPGSVQVYRNDAGVLTWLRDLPLTSRTAVVSDLDGDGFIDDALFSEYPIPIALIGEGGQLSVQGPLPEPPGPLVKYGTGHLRVADLDGDGWVEVFTSLRDQSRTGGRLWWGLPNGNFAEPRDQLWQDSSADGNPSFIGFAELDGVAPPELLYSMPGKLGYIRIDLANRLPFGCSALLVEPDLIYGGPVIGDLDADGHLEIALRHHIGVEVHTALAVP